VLTLAKKESENKEDILRFIMSLPRTRGDIASPEWQRGYCQQCLQQAAENAPDESVFSDSPWAYFLEYFPDRDRITQTMLIDAFMGVVFGVFEAEETP
jgi:hypothetical protein